MKLKDYIEEIPDFPVKGILFKDISPLLAKFEAMNYVKASFLDIIKSYLPKLNLSTFDLNNLSLELTLSLIAFNLVTFKQLLLISIPVP